MYIKKIRIFKYFLIIFICALLFSIIVYPAMFSQNKRVNLNTVKVKSSEKNRISNPKLLGKDSKGNNYEIKAEWGEYDDKNIFTLHHVNGKLNIIDEKTFDTISSLQARIKQDLNLLDLEGNIIYRSHDNMIVNANYATLDYKYFAINMHDSILINSNDLNLTADSLASQNGIYKFKGNIKLVVKR